MLMVSKVSLFLGQGERTVLLTLIGCLFLLLTSCGGGGIAIHPQVEYRLHGLCFSPYIELDPNQGAVVSAERIAEFLDIIAPYCRWIRTFGATHGLEEAPKLAKKRGLFVAAGCWLSSDKNTNEIEVNNLIKLIKEGWVDLAIVGSEVLFRHDLTEDEIIYYIRKVKETGIPSTTNDTWAELLEHPRVMQECDVIFANFYPYWEGVSIEQAIQSLQENYKRLKSSAGNKEVIVGETGWPSAGNPLNNAVPSLENAVSYILQFVSWAKRENIKYFYFEAFDEPWKAKYEGPQGAHWGIWDEKLKMKPGMIKVFNG
ncbi:glycosyl hydrolase [bacterium]|nr:glycosyl hydrolase [bacterium]